MALSTTFEIGALPQSSILYLFSIREKIDLEPHYQREGDVWSLYKRQLLIDSLINGFDIPKIYVHDLGPSKLPRYAVVDGKQRLQSIWAFLNGEFPLSDDFFYFSEPGLNLKGFYYDDIAKKYPLIKIRFDATSLTVVRVETADLEFIEEMFSRLNEAVPLSSAEKRRTSGGPVSNLISSVVQHEFFQQYVYFKDHRARYFDIASKLVFLEFLGSIADTKREFLDAFVRNAKNDPERLSEVKSATTKVSSVLDSLCGIFQPQDKLLRQVGLVPVYYWFVRACASAGVSLVRGEFQKFEECRDLLKKSEVVSDLPLSFDLAAVSQFNRLAQTPNDAYAIEFRVSVLVDHLVPASHKRAVLARTSRLAMFDDAYSNMFSTGSESPYSAPFLSISPED